MKECRMVEPDPFAGSRVFGYSRSHLASAQPITVFPFTIDAGLAAIFFDFGFFSGLKSGLPRQAKAISKVANIHPFLFEKAFSHLRRYALENFACIGNRRLPPLLGGNQTAEVKLHRQNFCI